MHGLAAPPLRDDTRRRSTMPGVSDDLEVVCPRGRRVVGATLGDGGVVCGVMEADRARADSILEGAPVGVFLKLSEDPSTIANLCCGQGSPVMDPDDLPNRTFGQGHYSACPIYVAGEEISAAERAFAPEPKVEVDPERGKDGFRHHVLDLDEDDIAYLNGKD